MILPRTGAVEIWGRGTNRLVEAREGRGIASPTFEEQAGALIVSLCVIRPQTRREKHNCTFMVPGDCIAGA